MNLKERNHADDHMIVGSLKILGKVEGGGITEIRRDVDLIQQQAEQIAKQQNQYWRDLSSDGIISPVEKQMLLKEWHNIQYSESAIYTQAIALGYDDSNPIIQTYLAAYNALYEYLYETLKLFNQMQEDTRIDSRETFDGMFNNYYYAESFVLIALSKGILDTINIRSLESLSEPGNEGEIGLYKGGIYQYVSGTWVSVSTGNYKGARNSFPAAVDDDFFLVSEDFTVTEGLYVNGEQLIVNNDELVITVKYKKGFIYYCKDGLWYCEYDKTNYRYVAAFADVLNVTGDLPEIFNVRLQELEEQIEEVAALSHVPKYLGVSSSLPQNPGEGDYFVYSGTTTGNFWRRSDIYRYDNGNWAHLDPSLSENNSYYMSALEDILTLNETSSGYFTAIFTQSFFSNNAVIENLSTRVLTLKHSGAIQSEVYTQGIQGFRIGSDGSVDFSGNVHIGGTTVISGNTTIEGILTTIRNAQIRGITDIFDTLHVQGNFTVDGPKTVLKNTFIDGVFSPGKNLKLFPPGTTDAITDYESDLFYPLENLFNTIGIQLNEAKYFLAKGYVLLTDRERTVTWQIVPTGGVYLSRNYAYYKIEMDNAIHFVNDKYAGVGKFSFASTPSSLTWGSSNTTLSSNVPGALMACHVTI